VVDEHETGAELPGSNPLWQKFWARAQGALQRSDVIKAEYWLLAAAGVASERCPALMPVTTRRLAYLYRKSDRLEEAERLYRVLGDAEALADVLEEKGDLAAAEAVLQDVVTRQGTTAPSRVRAKATLQLARLYHHAGRYVEAQDTYQRAIATFEPADGPWGPVEALGALALAYQDQGRYREAEEMLCKAARRKQGAGIAESWSETAHLAELCELQGRLDEAEGHYLRCMSLLEDAQKVFLPRYLHALARLAEARGAYDEAEGLYQEALDSWVGNRTPLRLDVARVLARAARDAEALSAYEGAFQDAGFEHVAETVRAAACQSFALLCRRQDRPAQADSLEHQAEALMQAWEQAPLAEHPDQARALDRLAAWLRAQDCNTLADRVETRCQTMRARHPGRPRYPLASL